VKKKNRIAFSTGEKTIRDAKQGFLVEDRGYGLAMKQMEKIYTSIKFENFSEANIFTDRHG